MSKQKRRLLQHTHCLNCGSDISSKFCQECGQRNKDYHLTLTNLFGDFLEELLDVDSRVLKSLKLLFTKPGFLTTEYVKGRRISYLPPVRIYLVASVLFFLTLSLNKLLPNVQNNEFFKEITQSGDIGGAFENAVGAMQLPPGADEIASSSSSINPTDSDSSNTQLSMTIGENPVDMDRDELLANFSDNFAKMMFFLLPVAAFLLKFLYFRRKKLYVEHLVFSLHVHAFIFSLLIFTVILDYKSVMWFVIISSLIYLFFAMKTFYAQSTTKTATKMILLLLSYGLTTMLVMTLTLAVTAVGLVLGNSG